MGDYQPLQCDGDFDQDCVQAAKMLHRAGNDAMTKDDIYFRKPMSPVRKLAFVFSVLVCFLTIAVFLWVIPCEWSKCPSKIQQLEWEETLYHLELMGPMQSVHSDSGLSLVSMVRGAEWPSSTGQHHQFPAHSGGLVCLQALSGAVAWWARLSQPPAQLSCSILDLDSNGVSDCLVQGDHGYLVAINSESGMKVWRFDLKLNEGERIERITFPVVIPDVNGDGVYDLAALCKCHSDDTHINYLVLVSGRDGTLIGRPLKITSCSDIYGLALDDDSSALYYTCKKQDSYENEVSQKLSELLSKALNRSVTRKWSHRSRLRQLLVSDGLVDFRVGNHKMSVLNSGHCPTSCSVSVNVTDQLNQTVWNYHANYTYVMNPVLIHFNHTITGFVLKFWYWLYPHQESHDLDKDTKLEKIRECIILVAFNASGETRIVNASQTDVTRICGSLGCQPELRYQTNSLLIDDLDLDGYQELVSNSVSFHELSPQEATPTSPNDFELHSKVQVIRLQAELPKLYEVMEPSHAVLLGLLVISLQFTTLLTASLGNDSLNYDRNRDLRNANNEKEGSGNYEETSTISAASDGENIQIEGSGEVKENSTTTEKENIVEGSKHRGDGSEGSGDRKIIEGDNEGSGSKEEDVDSEGSGEIEASGGRGDNKSNSHCLYLCDKPYMCNSDEVKWFELDFKGNRCVNVCGTNLICEHSSQLSSTTPRHKFGHGYSVLKTRSYSCGSNQRRDINGICRNKTAG